MINKETNKVIAGPFESTELPIYDENALVKAVEANISVFVGMSYDFNTNTFFMTWDYIRDYRNYMLMATDCTQLPDWPGDSKLWRTYRETLRNIPQSVSDANDVKFPEVPEIGRFIFRY